MMQRLASCGSSLPAGPITRKSGGIVPGSMPPFSKNLGEEGVLIQNFKLVDAGKSRFGELKQLLASGPYPSRSPDTNLADITAQVAANQQGALDLQKMVERYS